MKKIDKYHQMIRIWYGKKSKGKMIQGGNKESNLATVFVLCAPWHSGSKVRSIPGVDKYGLGDKEILCDASNKPITCKSNHVFLVRDSSSPQSYPRTVTHNSAGDVAHPKLGYYKENKMEEKNTVLFGKTTH